MFLPTLYTSTEVEYLRHCSLSFVISGYILRQDVAILALLLLGYYLPLPRFKGDANKSSSSSDGNPVYPQTLRHGQTKTLHRGHSVYAERSTLAAGSLLYRRSGRARIPHDHALRSASLLRKRVTDQGAVNQRQVHARALYITAARTRTGREKKNRHSRAI